jgi:hypothetical protein
MVKVSDILFNLLFSWKVLARQAKEKKRKKTRDSERRKNARNGINKN